MAVNPKFPPSIIEDYLTQICDIVQFEIVRSLSWIGEQALTRIRDRSGKDSWYDQTGNLRSSIGYAIFDHGTKVIESAFNTVLNGAAGPLKGKALINSLASSYAETYALVVVAGMDYASIVEAMENKDVLASAELWATNELDSVLQKTQERIVKRIESIRL